MPTPSENIKLAIEQTTARIVETTSSYKPSYSLDGESYSHDSYMQMLTTNLEALQRSLQIIEGPYTKTTRMRT